MSWQAVGPAWPAPRVYASMVPLADGRLIMQGGFTTQATSADSVIAWGFNDIWTLSGSGNDR